MAIFKVTPSELWELEMTYVVIPCETIALYKSAHGYAVHIYLLNKPEDWIIRDKDLINNIGYMGEKSLRRAISELKSVGLLRSIQLFDDDKRFAGKQRDLFAHPDQNPDFKQDEIPVTDLSGVTGEFTGLEGNSEAENTHNGTDEDPRNGPFPCYGKPVPRERAVLTHNELLTHDELITHGTADADAVPLNDSLDSEDSETKPPSEGMRFYDQRDFVERCMSAGIPPSLDDFKYLNSRNWVVDGRQLDLDAYIQERKS